MKNLNIVFTKPNCAELVERELSTELQNGCVLVRLERSSISSGTERANLIGDPFISINTTEPNHHFPRQCGYSSSGIIEAVADDVTSVKPGDRVAVTGSVHAQRLVISARQVYKLADNVTMEAAALAFISNFPMAAIRKCLLEMGESAIVMGQGVLGQIAVKLLRVAGAMPIIAADPDPAKRARALELGADAAVDPTAPDYIEKVHALTGKGANIAIEVTGIDKALDNALDALAPFGRVTLLGCTRHSNFAIDYYHKVHGRGITIIGAHTLARPSQESHHGWWTGRDDTLAFLKMLELGRLNLDGFVDEVHSPKEAPAVFDRLAKGGAFPVVQFDWTQV